MNSRLFVAALKLIAGMAIVMSTTAAMAAKYYKWVDESGVTHYSAQPPEAGKGEIIRVKSGQSSDKDAAMKRLEERRAKLQQDADARNNPKFDPQAEADKRNAEALKKQCENRRKNLKIMTENNRVRMLDENGESRVLPEEERQAKIKEAKDFISENCK